MTIRNLLVAFDGSDGARAALSLGLKMARKYDAHLTGILPHGAPPAHLWRRLAHEPRFLQRFLERDGDLGAKAKSDFHAVTAGHDKVHWLEIDQPGDVTLIDQARHFDMTLIGQPDPDHEDTGYALHPDRIALQSGRPLIVVPSGYDRPLGDKAALAWDGQRAAARALADAMLVLETKVLVTILHVASAHAPIDSVPLQQHLERHGILSEWVTLDRLKGGVGETLLHWCRENSPDLLVLGAYEHSKFREDLLGGVTSSVLRELTAPIFLAH